MEDEVASGFQDFVLELWPADLPTSVYESKPVDNTATQDILSIDQLASVEDSDEEDVAAGENLIQIAPVEPLKASSDTCTRF